MRINIKRNQKGFTIVETLIVLAIAAVIIIIVLLAVPALQRTTRNTDIKNDAAAIAGAINDYESNNGGAIPKTLTRVGNTVFICGTTTSSCTTKGAPKLGSTATVQSGDTICNVETSVTTAPSWGATPVCTSPGTMNAAYIVVDLKATCNNTTGNNAGLTLVASGNQAAVFYPDETGGTGNVECIQG